MVGPHPWEKGRNLRGGEWEWPGADDKKPTEGEGENR